MSKPDINSDQTVDEYQKNLSESVGDGGGCSETWDVLSQQRSGESTHTRREFAVAVGAAAIGFGFVSGSASAQETPESVSADEQPEYDLLPVEDQSQYLETRNEARSDSAVSKIQAVFESDGWELNEEDIDILKTVHEDGSIEQYTVSLPFEKSSSDAVPSIIWTNNPDIETKGIFGEGGSNGLRFTRYSVSDGEVVTSQKTISQDEMREARSTNSDTVTTDATVTPAATFPTCTWNTSCVGKIAAGFGGTFHCCAMCSSVIGAPACICCVTSALGTASIECNVCE